MCSVGPTPPVNFAQEGLSEHGLEADLDREASWVGQSRLWASVPWRSKSDDIYRGSDSEKGPAKKTSNWLGI